MTPRRYMHELARAKEREDTNYPGHFALSEAMLCANCDRVFRVASTCPACGSSGEFFMIASRFGAIRQEIQAAILDEVKPGWREG